MGKEKEIIHQKHEETEHLETLWRLRDEVMWEEEMKPGIEGKISDGKMLSRSEEMDIHQYGGAQGRGKLFAKSGGGNNTSENLKVSQPGDPLEKEADEIAGKVTSE